MSTVSEPSTNEATRATRAFIEVLNSEELSAWVNRFSEILAMLESGHVHEAIRLYAQIKYTGPGSLSDVYAKNETAFNTAWGSCSAALRALEAARR